MQSKEFFRTCNVLPFSCTHLALWRGKRPKVHAKQKGLKNFVNPKSITGRRRKVAKSTKKAAKVKEFFRTNNVLPFSLLIQLCGPKLHAKQKGFKNFFSKGGIGRHTLNRDLYKTTNSLHYKLFIDHSQDVSISSL